MAVDGDAGERTGGPVEDQVAREGLRCVAGDGEDAEREAADARPQDSGGTEAVGKRVIEHVG